MEALDKFVSYPPFDYLPVMVTKRERREQSSLDREGFSKGLRETTVVRRKNLDLETCRQGSMALGPRKFSKRLFQGLYENTGGEGD